MITDQKNSQERLKKNPNFLLILWRFKETWLKQSIGSTAVFIQDKK